MKILLTIAALISYSLVYSQVRDSTRANEDKFVLFDRMALDSPSHQINSKVDSLRLKISRVVQPHLNLSQAAASMDSTRAMEELGSIKKAMQNRIDSLRRLIQDQVITFRHKMWSMQNVHATDCQQNMPHHPQQKTS